MPFSLSSYLLGVGTIAGALAFGVGSGLLMSKSEVKHTSAAAQTRAERVVRSEPVAAGAPSEPAPATAPQVAEATEDPAAPVAAALTAPAVRPDPVPSVQPETPKAQAETSKTEARTETGEKRIDVPKQGASANASYQKPTAQEMRPAARRIERAKRYADRRTRRGPVEATRQWRSDDQDPPERPYVVYVPDQPRPQFFRVIRPSPFDRSDDLDDDR